MIDALDEESRAGEVSLSFRGWMLGRLLLASRQCSDVAAEAIFEKYLREVLDDVVTGRLRAGLEPEDVTASCEAWAWSYLLLHYGGEKAHEPSHWLRAARMAQAGAERLAAAASGGAGGHGDRLWASVLLTSALSAQHGCGTVASWREPLQAHSLQQRCEAASRLLRYDASAPRQGPASGALDFEAIPGHQLEVGEALRFLPRTDFRAWAVGLARLAEVQTAISCRRETPAHLLCSQLSGCFLEAMEESSHPGDKALGLANWLYATFVALWRESGDTERPLR